MKLDIDFAILVMGAAFVLLGVFIRLGNLKQVYWKSPRSMTSYIPLGLVFIGANYLDDLALQPRPVYYAAIAVFAVLVGLTLWFSTKAPDFMKPAWIRWVEKHPERVRKAMAEEAEGNKEWQANVVSEEAVDAWARQISRKAPPSKKK